MEITLRFAGNKRVDAIFGDRVVHTDQGPEHGGEGSAPEPFQLFLASLATCAGVYVLGFCQARDLPTDGIQLVQRHDFSEEGRLRRVTMQISVPADFPSKYVPALERVAAKCTVKRVIQEAPEFVIEAKARGSETALDRAAL
ncbi:MAG: OsmC family protein [Polyangiaceae bacterium]|nr:OsmC family protein [Polyangiaceae bacterium]MCE7890340.1 osmotically inducible protein C [Sorangiineae bacterium PRO1]MCL4752236.1 OsmC family protein [Myxococcales bacterium]